MLPSDLFLSIDNMYSLPLDSFLTYVHILSFFRSLSSLFPFLLSPRSTSSQPPPLLFFRKCLSSQSFHTPQDHSTPRSSLHTWRLPKSKATLLIHPSFLPSFLSSLLSSLFSSHGRKKQRLFFSLYPCFFHSCFLFLTYLFLLLLSVRRTKVEKQRHSPRHSSRDFLLPRLVLSSCLVLLLLFSCCLYSRSFPRCSSSSSSYSYRHHPPPVLSDAWRATRTSLS